MLVIIAPEFDESWKESITLNQKIVFYSYNELVLYRTNKLFKAIQFFLYLMDALLPRSMALSAWFRRVRIRRDMAQQMWSDLFKKIKETTSLESLIIIKPTGLVEDDIPEKLREKVKIVIWDSLSRYPIDRSVKKYLIGTTSPFDAKKQNIQLFTFFNKHRKHDDTDEETTISSRLYFVGRFSVLRMIKALYWGGVRNKGVFFLGKAPFSMVFRNVTISTSILNFEPDSNLQAVFFSDFNEDSPSLRLDNESVAPFVTDLRVVPSTLKYQDLYCLSYFSSDFISKVKLIAPSITFEDVLNER